MSDPHVGAQPPARTSGPGRVLIAVYWVFFVSAAARAGYQLATAFGQAPVAYLLSAVAAAIYGFSAFWLGRRSYFSWRMANLAAIVELAGVLVIGTFSVVAPQDFPRQTVWSYYGVGYACVPLILPLLALWWLRRTRPRRPDTTGPVARKSGGRGHR